MVYFSTNYSGINSNLNSEYIKNWIKKQIRDDTYLSEDDKMVLLEYPCVYIHAWENEKNGYSLYVGETYNLTQRLGEHIQSDDKWHNEWQKKILERKAFSWFFSNKDNMNESMALDLENSLCALLKDCSNLNGKKIDVKTIATTEQRDYSNKNGRDSLLAEIWNVLACRFDFFDFNDINKQRLTQLPGDNYSQNLVWSYMKPTSKEKDKIIEEAEKKFTDDPLLVGYPMVYYYVWKEAGKIKTYVGETDNFVGRTRQHLQANEPWETSWIESIENENAYLLAFGHRSFNKSMIKDIENRLILYTKFLQCSKNGRHNERGKYNNQNAMFDIFKAIIETINCWWNDTFKEESPFLPLDTVQKNAIGLASPFFELTESQEKIKYEIINEIDKTLNDANASKKLIVLYGGAGTGKTMLLSSLLFALYKDEECKCDLLVNNKELAPTYLNMLKIWQLGKADATIHAPIIYYASDYFKSEKCRDILLVDEGHLLNTRDHTGGAKEQLSKILDKARCTILVFDPFQFIDKNKHWEGKFSCIEDTKDSFVNFYENSIDICVFDLEKQLRMKCSDKTFKWISSLCVQGSELKTITGKCIRDDHYSKIISDDNQYVIGAYKNIASFYYDLKRIKENDKDTACLATYDWKYNSEYYWYVIGGEKAFHWHITGKGNKLKDDKGELSSLSWYKKAADDEVGSVHDIQGFDLNYAFVIIGKSIKYNPTRGNKKGKKGIQVYAGQHKTNHNIEFILNELRVLLTRGIKGVMIYSVDDNLREELFNSLKCAGEQI